MNAATEGIPTRMRFPRDEVLFKIDFRTLAQITSNVKENWDEPWVQQWMKCLELLGATECQIQPDKKNQLDELSFLATSSQFG